MTPPLALFFGAALALLLTPGPAVLYIVARSIDQGRRAGFLSILGMSTGTLVHLAVVVVGASALLASSHEAFVVMKYLGAAYLAWLGISRLLARDDDDERDVAAPRSGRRIFADATVVALLNPKSILFLFAFLPQFVNPARGAAWLQLLLLGLTFLAMALVTDSAWVLAADAGRSFIHRSRRVSRVGRVVSAGVYLALAIALMGTTHV